MGYPAERFAAGQQAREACEQLLPLRLPANLQPAGPSDASTAEPAATDQLAEPVGDDAESPPIEVSYRGGPVEFERVMPPSGNLGVSGKQFWLGPVRAGVTVTF